MSLTKTLTDKLKSAPIATSVSGLSTVLVNALGELVRTGAIMIQTYAPGSFDMDEIRDWRIIVFNSLSHTVNGAPFKANGMVLIALGDYHIVLRAGEGGKIYYRAYSGGWQPWKTVV